MRRFLPPLFALLFLMAGCSGEDVDETDVGDVDTGADVTGDSDADIGDADGDADGDGDSDRVAFDYRAYLDDAPDPGGSVSVFQVSDASELIEGSNITGQVGDFILENDQARFVVGGADRNMSVCPFGGNVIDAESRLDSAGGNILQELCLFLNADQTFTPETFEILRDGSDGAGVLAVTGTSEILDYLNVEGMIAELNESLANSFELKPDDVMPLKITIYYILRPGDQGLRVFSMMENEGDEQLDIVVSHLFASGGDGAFFNPLSSLGGFGYQRLGLLNPNPDLLPYLAFIGSESGVAYMPRPDENIPADLPVSGSYLTIFNVVASVLGRTDIITTLLSSRSQLADMSGILHIEPGGIGEVEHWLYVSDGSLSTMTDVIYEELGAETGTVDGMVLDTTGAAAVGARVSAVDDQGRTMNQTLTGSDGSYSMRLPTGSYTVVANLPGQVTLSPQSVSVAADSNETVADLAIELAGTVEVSVRTPDGEPTPARVTLICEDDCPLKESSNSKDVTFDQLPGEFAAVEWVGVSGDHTFVVPQGSYRVVVSRGMEWSLWPADTRENGGELIEVVAGDSVEVNAEIAQVLDTSGALSGDFHVHAINSIDSTTPEMERVLTFLAEGMDVIVSSDHDVVSDFGPAVDSLGAGDEIVSLVGNEVTTIDLGHFNTFPVERDPNSRNGGALDWGDGTNLAHPPSEIFEGLRNHAGEQVVQINHPDSSFLSFSDVVRGVSYGNTSRMRVRTEIDTETGDTGLWSDDFTAMELMNGHNQDRFWGVARWWLQLIGRGHTPAGTAVTDTHTRYDHLGGVPRTYTFVDGDKDRPGSFDAAHFVDSVNNQSAIGTNGPFVRVEASNSAGSSAGIGQVLSTDGEPVTFELTIEVPEWINVDRVQMVMNSEEVLTEPGEYNTDPFAPTETVNFELTEDDLEVVATGAEEHRRYRKVVEFEVDTDVDAYVVFFIRGSGDLYPVVPHRSVRPFAFTNPVYLDADGGGYDNPHLAELAESAPLDPSTLLMLQTQESGERLSREEILRIVGETEVVSCH